MPATFDMTWDELVTYQGSNPRPNDFDAYWAQALADLDHVDPNIELVPANFQSSIADCYHLYFTGVGGARVHAQLLRPKNVGAPQPAVLMFHGYFGNAGDWNNKLAYVAEGYTVAALDCRGQGGLSEDNGQVKGWTLYGHIIRGLDDEPERLLYRQIFLDTAQLARIVMDFDTVDEHRVGAMGRSQGGALTIACAALEPRIKLAAPIYPFLSDYKRTWEIDLLEESAYEEIREYFRRFDPLHKREAEIFTRLGYIDVQFLAPRIEAEVMLFVGLEDKICPPSTQFAAYNKMTCKKSLAIYPEYAHEADIPGMYDTIFQFLRGL